MEETGVMPTSYYGYDFNKYQTERQKLNRFLEYRQQFEKSQQVRIQTKIKKLEEVKTQGAAGDNQITDAVDAVDSDDELGNVLGIPYLKFDLLDPR